MQRELRWSTRAKTDLREIYEFIARDSISAADRLIEKLSARPLQLLSHPDSGRVVPEIGDLAIRELMEGSCRIVYQVDRNAVIILRINHHARRLHVK